MCGCPSLALGLPGASLAHGGYGATGAGAIRPPEPPLWRLREHVEAVHGLENEVDCGVDPDWAEKDRGFREKVGERIELPQEGGLGVAGLTQSFVKEVL